MTQASSIPPNNQKPLQIKEIREMAIAISANKLNPAMLSEEFLKASGIVPTDWALNKEPVLSPNYAQVSFQNGVTILAQPRTITFLEMLGTKELKELIIAGVAHRYLEKLPYSEYQGISISPKSVVPLSGSPDANRKFMTSTILAPGSWQDFGIAPLQASVNLLYQLEHCQLSLTINEARIELPDRQNVPALLFSGNFNYTVKTNNQEERLKILNRAVDDWQVDLQTFREIVHERFLGEQTSVFPGIVINAPLQGI